MTVFIDPLYPTPPSAESRQMRRSITSEQLRGFMDKSNHLAVVRPMEGFRHPILWKPTNSYTDAPSSVLYDDPQGISGTVYVPWTVSPYVSRVAIAIGYQASPEYTTSPLLSIELNTRAGADVDLPAGGAAVTWSVANGLLPTDRRRPVDLRPNAGVPGTAYPVLEYPELEVATGTRTVGDVRSLDVSGVRNTAVVLIVTHTACRPLWVDVQELRPEEV